MDILFIMVDFPYNSYELRENNEANTDNSSQAPTKLYCFNHLTNSLSFIHSERLIYATKPCTGVRCKTCPFISRDLFVFSSIANKPIVNSLQKSADCSTTGLVYLIKCKKCQMQYVGQTNRALRERCGQHRRSVEANSLSTLLVKHFNSDGHSINDMTIQVLQIVSDKKERLEAEDRWMRILNSVYPFGLNSMVKSYGIAEDKINPSEVSSQPYFNYSVRREARPHRRKRRTRFINTNWLVQFQEISNRGDF